MPRNERNQHLSSLLELLSAAPKLLVATDFDGTISDFTSDPAKSTINPVAKVALRKLSEMPNTFVAVISGRSLRDLHNKTPGLDRIRRIGSHGHEFDLDEIKLITTEQIDALRKAENLVKDLVLNIPGSRIEHKPHGVAFHYRGVKKNIGSKIALLRRQLQKLKSGIIRDGKKVLEYSAVDTNKGQSLLQLANQLNPTSILFIGDDVTDESVFKVLRSGDAGIKIGKGKSAARFRTGSPSDAVKILAKLSEMRQGWITSGNAGEINKHLFLSDLRTTALIDDTGSLVWLCTPRLDSAPLFGALVGGYSSGHFRVQAEGKAVLSYEESGLIGKIKFKNVTVTDFLNCSGGRSFQRAGRSDLIRIIEGKGKVNLEFAPKFNFGRVPTRLTAVKDGLRIECGQQLLFLYSPGCRWKIKREGLHDVADCSKILNGGKIETNLLLGTATPESTKDMPRLLKDTRQFWKSWADTLTLPKLEKELVKRSAVVLRGLTYGPTGAIAAASTTSLPETIGGIRNWDYRYCWPRDACYAAIALLRLKAPGPATRMLDWILEIILDSSDSSFLAPLYTVTGRKIQGEAEVPEAAGYRGSLPVRIGNLAAEQLQLDTLGPIAELMLKLAEHRAALSTEHMQLCEYLVNLVAARWKDPDSGIWEIRGEQRHYIHSKLMCWYTVTCCIKVSEYLGIKRISWKELAQKIRKDIELKGYSKKLNSYVAAYDLPHADAALLWIILSGFHAPSHPRSLGTLNFIETHLVYDNSVFRYKFDDSLHGKEGEFIICRAWLIETLALCQQGSKAKKYFKEMISRSGPLGLFAEQWDGKKNISLGNYPQAYSHTGLINAACALNNL